MALEHHLSSQPSSDRMRVLIVDSNDATKEGLRQALAESCALIFASGQREALSLAAVEAPDLVVSEVDLAEGNGFALMSDLRRQPQTQRIPLMLLTERASVDDRVAAYTAGADDYVVKPFDTRLFHARLRLLARIKRIQNRQS